MYKSKKDFYEKWAIQREKGFKSYLFTQFKNSLIFIVKGYFITVVLLTLGMIIQFGWDITDFIYLAKLSLIVFFIPLPMLAMSASKWKENENMFLNYSGDISVESKKYITELEAVAEFTGFKYLKILTYLFFVLPLIGIVIIIYGLISQFNYSLYVAMLPFLLFLIITSYLQRHFKNPICNHKIFDISDDKRHPEAEGGFGDNLWSITWHNKFTCFECNQKYLIIKKENKNYLLRQ